MEIKVNKVLLEGLTAKLDDKAIIKTNIKWFGKSKFYTLPPWEIIITDPRK